MMHAQYNDDLSRGLISYLRNIGHGSKPKVTIDKIKQDLRNGANPNFIDQDEYSPLTAVMQNTQFTTAKKLDIVKVLTAHGADYTYIQCTDADCETQKRTEAAHSRRSVISLALTDFALLDGLLKILLAAAPNPSVMLQADMTNTASTPDSQDDIALKNKAKITALMQQHVTTTSCTPRPLIFAFIDQARKLEQDACDAESTTQAMQNRANTNDYSDNVQIKDILKLLHKFGMDFEVEANGHTALVYLLSMYKPPMSILEFILENATDGYVNVATIFEFILENATDSHVDVAKITHPSDKEPGTIRYALDYAAQHSIECMQLCIKHGAHVYKMHPDSILTIKNKLSREQFTELFLPSCNGDDKQHNSTPFIRMLKENPSSALILVCCGMAGKLSDSHIQSIITRNSLLELTKVLLNAAEWANHVSIDRQKSEDISRSVMWHRGVMWHTKHKTKGAWKPKYYLPHNVPKQLALSTMLTSTDCIAKIITQLTEQDFIALMESGYADILPAKATKALLSQGSTLDLTSILKRKDATSAKILRAFVATQEIEHFEIMKERNIDYLTADSDGGTVLTYALTEPQQNIYFLKQLLLVHHISAWKNEHYTRLKQCINSADKKANGQTPLMLAIVHDHCNSYHYTKVIEYLGEHTTLDAATSTSMLATASGNRSEGALEALCKAVKAQLPIQYINIVNTVDNNGYTPLMKAASKGRQSSIAILLENGANPFVTNARNETALFYAIQECTDTALDTIGTLCTNMQNKDQTSTLKIINLCNTEGITPLMCAIRNLSIRTIDALVVHGAQFDIVDSQGKNILHHFAAMVPDATHPLSTTKLHDTIDSAFQHIGDNTKLFTMKDVNGLTPLDYCFENKNYHLAAKIIEHFDEIPENLIKEGHIVLQHVITCGMPNSIVQLIAEKINLSEVNEHGQNTLHQLAILAGNKQTKEVAEQAFDTIMKTMKKADDYTPLLTHDSTITTPLSYCLKMHNSELARKIIEYSDRTLTDALFEGEAPLHYALIHGAPISVLELIIQKTDLTIVSETGHNALHHIAQLQQCSDNDRAFDLLLRQITTNKPLVARNEQGLNPLDCCIMHHRPDLAENLIAQSDAVLEDTERDIKEGNITQILQYASLEPALCIIILQKKPQLIKCKDKDGNTVFHHLLQQFIQDASHYPNMTPSTQERCSKYQKVIKHLLYPPNNLGTKEEVCKLMLIAIKSHENDLLQHIITNPNMRQYSNTIYMQKTFIMHAISANNLEALFMLIELGKANIEMLDAQGRNILHHIALKKSTSSYSAESMDSLFTSHREQIIAMMDTQNSKGESPIMIAAKYGNNKLVEHLLEFGVNLELQSNHERKINVLHYAAQGALNASTLQKLCDKCPHLLHTKTLHNLNPVEWALIRANETSIRVFLFYLVKHPDEAAFHNYDKYLHRALFNDQITHMQFDYICNQLQQNIDNIFMGQHNTLLCYAIINGDLGKVKLLLTYKADITHPSVLSCIHYYTGAPSSPAKTLCVHVLSEILATGTDDPTDISNAPTINTMFKASKQGDLTVFNTIVNMRPAFMFGTRNVETLLQNAILQEDNSMIQCIWRNAYEYAQTNYTTTNNDTLLLRLNTALKASVKYATEHNKKPQDLERIFKLHIDDLHKPLALQYDQSTTDEIDQTSIQGVDIQTCTSIMLELSLAIHSTHNDRALKILRYILKKQYLPEDLCCSGMQFTSLITLAHAQGMKKLGFELQAYYFTHHFINKTTAIHPIEYATCTVAIEILEHLAQQCDPQEVIQPKQTPSLCIAIMTGETECIQWHAKYQAQHRTLSTSYSYKYWEPLLYAIANNDSTVLSTVIQHVYDNNITKVDPKTSNTLAAMALIGPHPDQIKVLIEQGLRVQHSTIKSYAKKLSKDGTTCIVKLLKTDSSGMAVVSDDKSLSPSFMIKGKNIAIIALCILAATCLVVCIATLVVNIVLSKQVSNTVKTDLNVITITALSLFAIIVTSLIFLYIFNKDIDRTVLLEAKSQLKQITELNAHISREYHAHKKELINSITAQIQDQTQQMAELTHAEVNTAIMPTNANAQKNIKDHFAAKTTCKDIQPMPTLTDKDPSSRGAKRKFFSKKSTTINSPVKDKDPSSRGAKRKSFSKKSTTTNSPVNSNLGITTLPNPSTKIDTAEQASITSEGVSNTQTRK